MEKSPALMQVDVSNFNVFPQSLSTAIDAASLSGDDEKKTVALAQTHSEGRSQDTEDQNVDAEQALMTAGSLDPEAYGTHNMSIAYVLEDPKGAQSGTPTYTRRPWNGGGPSRREEPRPLARILPS